MKILLLVAFAIVVLVFLSGRAQAAKKGSFDGAWSVTIVCHEHTDEGKTAESYTFHYAVQVRDGILHGERLSPGEPGWMTLDGTIHADGSAELHAHGLTNRPVNTLRHVQQGTPYYYDATGQFHGSRGVCTRFGGRACELTFTR